MAKKLDFEKASYLSQLHRLRALAELALTKYPVRVKKIEFINHGENTTFKVTDLAKKNCPSLKMLLFKAILH